MTVSLQGPYNLRKLLIDLDNTTDADILSIDGDITTVSMDNGLTAEFRFGNVFINSATDLVLQVDLAEDLTLENGPGVRDAINSANLSGITTGFFASHSEARIQMTPGDEFFSGVGNVRGGAGTDYIGFSVSGLEPDEVQIVGPSIGRGGDDNDVLSSDGVDAILYGEDGDDRLFSLDGNTRMFGGAGDDEFIFDSSGYGNMNGTLGGRDANGRVVDFTSGADSLVFSVYNATTPAADGTKQTLADLAGDGTLADLDGEFIFEDLTFSFKENAKGYAVITRGGTTNGIEVDERAVIKDVGLDEIQTDDVSLWFQSVDPLEI